jgi:hypothetical protein
MKRQVSDCKIHAGAGTSYHMQFGITEHKTSKLFRKFILK